MTPSDEPPIYTLRTTEDARRQIDIEIARLYDTLGDEAAVSWRTTIEHALASLATFPGRCPFAPENSLYQQDHPGPALHQLIVHRSKSNSIWRLLFTIHEQTSSDPPTVFLLQARHGAQSPWTG